MPNHRFLHLLTGIGRPGVADPTFGPAFVPCSAVLALSPAHAAQVAAVYRLAAERTRRQLAPACRPLPAFSAN